MGNSNTKKSTTTTMKKRAITPNPQINRPINLLEIDPTIIESVPRKGHFTECIITNIHDGDTVSILFLIGSEPFKINLRLEGIDAPEISSKNYLEREAGLAVKQWLSTLLSTRSVWFVLLKNWDKYGGRVVGTLHASPNSESINKGLLDLGFVVPYSGRVKKQIWSNEKLQEILDNCK